MRKSEVIDRIQKRYVEADKDFVMFDIEAYYDELISPEENLRILNEMVDKDLGKAMKEIVKELKSDKYDGQGQNQFEEWIREYPQEIEEIVNLLRNPKIIGLIADANSGKSNLLYGLIKLAINKYSFKLYSYGLRINLGEQKIYSTEELESITNSVIILDEYFNLLDLEDRKKRKEIERTIRLIYHNNNVLILAGVPENFKKFISNKLNIIIYGKSTIGDFINGSKAKERACSYAGSELGSAVLKIPLGSFIIWDGEHYKMFKCPYLEEYDTKKKNVDILVPKSVPNNVQKEITEVIPNDEESYNDLLG